MSIEPQDKNFESFSRDIITEKKIYMFDAY